MKLKIETKRKKKTKRNDICIVMYLIYNFNKFTQMCPCGMVKFVKCKYICWSVYFFVSKGGFGLVIGKIFLRSMENISLVPKIYIFF